MKNSSLSLTRVLWTFRHNIEFTTDETYKSSVYNILAVGEQQKYSITPLKDETELVSSKEQKRINGNKGENNQRASNYEVYDGALINSTVLSKRIRWQPYVMGKLPENRYRENRTLVHEWPRFAFYASYTFTKGF